MAFSYMVTSGIPELVFLSAHLMGLPGIIQRFIDFVGDGCFFLKQCEERRKYG